MDIVTFVEEYLGIKLLPYQKKYLKWLSNQDTWITRTPKTECSLIMKIMKDFVIGVKLKEVFDKQL